MFTKYAIINLIIKINLNFLRRCIAKMIYVISISLQLAGSLLLMMNALSTNRKKVIQRFAGKGIISRDNDTKKINYNTLAFKEIYKEAYLTKISFSFIAIGYFLSVFGSIENINKIYLVVYIVIVTMIIMVVAYFVVNIILKYSKKVNKDIDDEELKTIGIEPDFQNISSETINELP